MIWQCAISLASVLGFFPIRAEDRKEPSVPIYGFQVVDRTPVQLRLPEGSSVWGHLDRYGEFHRNPRSGLNFVGNVVNINDAYNGSTVIAAPFERVYEFRSGWLVPGVIGLSPGRFSPNGETIISIDDYTPSWDNKPRIYNLPGQFKKLELGQKRKSYNSQVYILDLESKLEAAKAETVSQESAYEYRPYGSRIVGITRETSVAFGRINDKGTFIENREIAVLPYNKQMHITLKTADGKEVSVPILNHPRSPKEAVYEYRSGVLTAGRLTDDGEFLPVEGAVVFQSYAAFAYSEQERRIYNYPGEFVKKIKK